MLGLDKHKNAGGEIFMSSMKGLANILALVATFLGTGPIFTATKGWIYAFGVSHYGEASADLVTMLWGVIVAALIFFISRATLATAIMFGAVAVMMRLV